MSPIPEGTYPSDSIAYNCIYKYNAYRCSNTSFPSSPWWKWKLIMKAEQRRLIFFAQRPLVVAVFGKWYLVKYPWTGDIFSYSFLLKLIQSFNELCGSQDHLASLMQVVQQEDSWVTPVAPGTAPGVAPATLRSPSRLQGAVSLTRDRFIEIWERRHLHCWF